MWVGKPALMVLGNTVAVAKAGPVELSGLGVGYGTDPRPGRRAAGVALCWAGGPGLDDALRQWFGLPATVSA